MNPEQMPAFISHDALFAAALMWGEGQSRVLPSGSTGEQEQRTQEQGRADQRTGELKDNREKNIHIKSKVQGGQIRGVGAGGTQAFRGRCRVRAQASQTRPNQAKPRQTESSRARRQTHVSLKLLLSGKQHSRTTPLRRF